MLKIAFGIRDVIEEVIDNLGLAPSVRAVVLMGGVDDGAGRDLGESEARWDDHPERDTIVVGTQDMLLSRALNRGYGMSRYRWPMHFALLDNDCLWVIDEVQLAGAGVATTAQLQALRRKLGTTLPVQTTWMSATLSTEWLRTVDVDDGDLSGHLALDDADRGHPVVLKRIGARKHLARADSRMGDTRGLATEIVAAHRRATRTLVVVNTVDRAREVHAQIRRLRPAAPVVLLHSRFRGPDRRRHLAAAIAPPAEQGSIVISTQVVEAGVDLTSAILFTDLAPWASLVQRFGRCNRAGDDPDARVFWIDLPADQKLRRKVDKPYDLEDLVDAAKALAGQVDVGPAALPRRAISAMRTRSISPAGTNNGIWDREMVSG